MFETVAIVGATGAVGRLIRQMLEERDFPYRKIRFLASKRSAGTTITFKGEEHPVEELRPEAFEGVDLAIGSTPDDVAKEFAPWAVERNCVVVDESGYWRMDPKVPLVVPEVNPEAIETHQGLISSPNCSTTQMVVAMKPLSTLMRPMQTVNLQTGERGAAVTERSDVVALAAAAVVGEAMMAIVIADALLEKFGGDSMAELRRNLDGYVHYLHQRHE